MRATKILSLILIAMVLATGCLASKPQATPAPITTPPAAQELHLATTTSTCDTGILDALNRPFEKKYNARVLVVCEGTGKAITTGELGAADVVMVHAPKLEEEAVDRGSFVDRRYLMYNDFVIIGPDSDSAGIKGLKNATEAFKKIAQAQVPFLSRGDKSGTETKEKEIWAAANITPTGTWYKAVGKGMGDTIVMANAQEAYTLSDRGTYLAMKGNISLAILAEKDPVLFNPYHIMAVNPAKYPDVKYKLAETYMDYLTSPEVQKFIADFGREQYGEPLFVPTAGKESQSPTTAPQTTTPSPTMAPVATVSQAPKNPVAIAVLDYPPSGARDDYAAVKWSITGGDKGKVEATKVVWSTGSIKNLTNLSVYRYVGKIYTGQTPATFMGDLRFPNCGDATAFFRIYAKVDGQEYFSKEVKIPGYSMFGYPLQDICPKDIDLEKGTLGTGPVWTEPPVKG